MLNLRVNDVLALTLIIDVKREREFWVSVLFLNMFLVKLKTVGVNRKLYDLFCVTQVAYIESGAEKFSWEI